MKTRHSLSNWIIFLVGLCLFVVSVPFVVGAPPSPFRVTADLEIREGSPAVCFKFEVPPEHIIYFDRLHFISGRGEPLLPADIPAPLVFKDKVTGHEKKGYNHDFSAVLKLEPALPQNFTVKFQ